MRKSLIILLSAELLVAAALGRLGHLDRPAALEWNQHPTVETRRAFEREKQMEEVGRLLFTGGVFTVLASATIFVYWLRRGDPLMLILKRFGTALVLFIILFPVLFVGSSVMGVGIVGSHAEASHYQSGYKEGEVGAGFGRDYGAIFFSGALGISLLASVTIAFSGVFPWCRRRSQPPKLPASTATPRHFVIMGIEPDRSPGFAWSERKLAHPGFWMAVLLMLVVLGIQLAVAMPLGLIDGVREGALHKPRLNLASQPLIVGCINLVAFGTAIVLGLFLNRLHFRKAFPVGRITGAQVVSVAALLLGVLVVVSEVNNLFRALLPPPRWFLNFLQDLLFSKHQLLSRVFLLVIVAPLTEELLFRGIILRGLLSRFRPDAAIVLTAFLFAAAHLNPWQFFSTLLLGCAFGWFYLRTGSVALCVLAHAFVNVSAIVFSALPWHIPGMTGNDLSKVEFQAWWLTLSGLAMVLAGIWGFRKVTPCTDPEDTPAPPVIEPGEQIAPRKDLAGLGP